MVEKNRTSLNLRKFAKPKQVERKKLQPNDQEMITIPTPMGRSESSQESRQATANRPARAPRTPNHQSTAENFKNIYTDPSHSASYSANLQAIANGIESYRYKSL